MTEQDTTTVKTAVDVEIPTVDERELGDFYLLVNTVGEVLDTCVDAKAAEGSVRELAKGKSCGEFPVLFVVPAKAVPTDEALAQAALASSDGKDE